MGLRIPKNQIITGKYTAGKEYMFVSTYREYIGYYYELQGKLYAGKEFDIRAPELILINSDQVNKLLINPNTYIYGKVSGTKVIQTKIESTVFTPTEDDYAKGSKIRYFVKKINANPIIIKEVNQTNYNTIKADPLYQVLEANVKLYPTENDLDILNKQMLGLKDYLKSESLPNISDTYSA